MPTLIDIEPRPLKKIQTPLLFTFEKLKPLVMVH